MPDPKKPERGQMLSDRRADLVSRNKLTFDAALKLDKADDAKVMKTISVSYKTQGSSQNTTSKTKGSKPTFRYDRFGKLVAE